MILNDDPCVWQNRHSWFWTGYSNQKQMTELQACWTYFLTVIKQSPQQQGRNLWFVMMCLAVMLHKLNIWLQSMQVNPNWIREMAISLLPRSSCEIQSESYLTYISSPGHAQSLHFPDSNRQISHTKRRLVILCDPAKHPPVTPITPGTPIIKLQNPFPSPARPRDCHSIVTSAVTTQSLTHHSFSTDLSSERSLNVPWVPPF